MHPLDQNTWKFFLPMQQQRHRHSDGRDDYRQRLRRQSRESQSPFNR